MTYQLDMLIRQYGATVDSYAAGASTAGTAGTATQVGTAIPGLLFPATERGLLGDAPLAGARVDYWWVDHGTAVVPVGGQIRNGTAIYYVQGTADWRLGRACGLSLPF